MDPEIKKELEEIQVLEKDNNRMLRSIRRGQWFSTFWTILVWALAISLPLYLYQQYIQPIVSRYYEKSENSHNHYSWALWIPDFR